MSRALAGAAVAAGAVAALLVAAAQPPTGGQQPSTVGGGACQVSPVGLAPGAKVTLPIVGKVLVTSDFGARWGTLHDGIDFASPSSVPVLAFAPGTVTAAGMFGGAGNMVSIDHGGGVVTTYMHMIAGPLVKQGQAVQAGTQVGSQGTTGDSTGPHLHFRVHVNGTPMDPRPFLAKAGIVVPPEGQWMAGPAGPAGASTAGTVTAGFTPDCDSSPIVTAGLKSDAIPKDMLPWVIKAGSMCKQIPPNLVAAQIDAESQWNPRAVSGVGAQGLSQFMPGTWAAYGRDDDGNGTVSPWDIGDAIMAQGRLDCELAATLKGVNPSADIVDLVLAGYNAGPGAVINHGGVPPYGETQAYVPKIKTLAATKYGEVR